MMPKRVKPRVAPTPIACPNAAPPIICAAEKLPTMGPAFLATPAARIPRTVQTLMTIATVGDHSWLLGPIAASNNVAFNMIYS
ncbi:MAG: hypothetical protein HC778_08870 [Chamaesiphon sp. CSU_1_12]|nr:hypothetical protein [Chamaesiphon sp. CSU_1_12]